MFGPRDFLLQGLGLRAFMAAVLGFAGGFRISVYRIAQAYWESP